MKKNILFLSLIIFLGLLFRLAFIQRPEGLWNDEYVSWFIASTPLNQGFWNEVLKQCHMPLYYLYLKVFTPFSDTVLRLTSVVPSLISIVVMYFAGKEISENTAKISALITAFLPFLIYYSQEVRFYSLVFLLSALLVLFTIKSIKQPSSKNLIFYCLISIILVLTHVLGIIFVFFNTVYLLYKIRFNSFSMKTKAVMAAAFFLAFGIVIPLGLNVLAQLPSSQWWGRFTYTNILFLFSDFFSPILTNNVNAPAVFFYNKSLALWLTVPTIIGITGLINGIKSFKGFFTVSFLTLVVMCILAHSGFVVFITKYSIELLPIFILVMSFGFDKLKKIGIILLSILILFYFAGFFTQNYPTKKSRSEGHRIVAELIKAEPVKTVIFTYYEPNRFYRYVDLNGYNTLYISKINRFEYKDNPVKILDNIQKGEPFSIIFLDSVSFIPNEALDDERIPEMFRTFSGIKNKLLQEIGKNYKIIRVKKLGAWSMVTAVK